MSSSHRGSDCQVRADSQVCDVRLSIWVGLEAMLDGDEERC